ncbi:hypothetical protein [Stigmatella aurantiaca]|uniref:Uncharacterized protein n=1 Tax=Stigmatella aurantiaca (strain DW4/3-1) TaxID=378806 RepID=Q090I0_STIAD|nr:hypothetical protein [Stigmatella aurantiaca]ADO70794.1 uncharacterized protein STAUR_3002 [Stigmatella aurantiaca DW4/3-1]EAU66125.1 hypothetical protein STIAU_4319 [Stigmatella aurantiaca DW4/3-1]
MATLPSLESLREQLRQSPFIPELATELGVSLEEYIEQVARFALHPQQEPQLAVVLNEELLAQGHAPPREEEMARYLERAVLVASAEPSTNFPPTERAPVSPTGETRDAQEPDLQREELQAYLELQRLKARITLD